MTAVHTQTDTVERRSMLARKNMLETHTQNRRRSSFER